MVGNDMEDIKKSKQNFQNLDIIYIYMYDNINSLNILNSRLTLPKKTLMKIRTQEQKLFKQKQREKGELRKMNKASLTCRIILNDLTYMYQSQKGKIKIPKKPIKANADSSGQGHCRQWG